MHSFIGCSQYHDRACGFNVDYAKNGKFITNKEGFYAMPLTPEAKEDRIVKLRNRGLVNNS
jgi:hypothetical protein